MAPPPSSTDSSSNNTTQVQIEYDDKKRHNLVEIAGEFSQWNKLELHPDIETRYTRIIRDLKPGNSYMYKFIVDGEWLLASDGRPFSKLTKSCFVFIVKYLYLNMHSYIYIYINSFVHFTNSCSYG